MFLLRSDFFKDTVVLLVVTIVLISLMAIAVGYGADFYFGDTISGLIGGYGEYDLALIVDKSMKDEAKGQLEELIASRLKGSRLTLGLEALGKATFFIKLDNNYQKREFYLEVDNYFKNISGFNSLSILLEPRITVRGLNAKAKEFLEPKFNSLTGVRFTFRDSDKLEVVLDKPELLTSVKKDIEEILESYYLLSIRFPITQKPEQLLKLGDQLIKEINANYDIQAKNMTTTSLSNLDALVKTMTEMKKFLTSYSTEVIVNLNKDAKLKEDDKLILPSKNKEGVIVRIDKIEGDMAIAVIETGDSRDVLGTKAYYLKEDSLGSIAGEIKVSNPRQELAYVVQELSKLVPSLDSIFTDTDAIIQELLQILGQFELLEDSIFQIKGLKNELTVYQRDFKEIDINNLINSVDKLERAIARLIKILEKLQFLRNLIREFNLKLSKITVDLRKTNSQLSELNPYRKSLEELENTIDQLAVRIDSNTANIIDYINQYNPFLEELILWQNDIKRLDALLAKVENKGDQGVEEQLKKVIDKDLISRIDNLDTKTLKEELFDLKKKILKLESIDLRAIISELEYIQQTLPKLKDEEITGSIDLIDQHISGKVIPGGEISLLLSKDTNFAKLREVIKQRVSQVTIYKLELGMINPNLRGQIYQILGEVKMLLTALTAIILTIFSLLFDQSLIISSLRISDSRVKSRWPLDFSLSYGVLIGAITLGSIFYLTGAKIPYIPAYTSILLGGILGLVTVNKAETMNKISLEEFRAAKALGFNYAEIMREIVIPTAKPGLLKLLNRRKTYF